MRKLKAQSAQGHSWDSNPGRMAQSQVSGTLSWKCLRLQYCTEEEMGWRELPEAITQPACEELGPEFSTILSSRHPQPDNKESVSGMAW